LTWYLAGPVTGMDNWNREAFESAKDRLEKAGLTVWSPFDSFNPEETWEEAMRRCIRGLLGCVGIVLLEGWEESRGAKLEVEIARTLDLTVVRYGGLFPREE
jgi:nucleoside 2-deoxyribosyltransferase